MTNQAKGSIDILLSESFKEIASVRPIEKITIKEITDKAGVIRPTFYNHFQDKYELIEWIVEKEILEPMQPFIEEMKIKDGISEALQRMQQDKDFYTNANRLVGQNSFKEILFMSIKKLLLKYFDVDSISKAMPFKWLTPDVLAAMLSDFICFAITQWIDEGMKISPDELAETFVFVSYHSMLELFIREKN